MASRVTRVAGIPGMAQTPYMYFVSLYKTIQTAQKLHSADMGADPSSPIYLNSRWKWSGPSSGDKVACAGRKSI